jgi:radical SAM protein with 4Fe4S-binding SPASM domain
MNFLETTRKKYYDAVKNPVPMLVGFNITQDCNLNCKLCGAGSGEPVEGELTTEEAKKVISNLSKSGVGHLSFGGGEPLVRKDIIELARYAVLRLESVGIVSNGMALDNSMARQIAKAGVKQVMVSLDGKDAATHDANRGAGSYARVIAAIKNLQDAGVTTRISFTISRNNCQQLPDLIEIATEYGVNLHVQEFSAKGRGSGKESLVLTRRERRDMQRLLYKTQTERGAGSIGFENRYIMSEDKKGQEICTDPYLGSGFYDFCVGCFTGIYSLFVSPTGEVRLCGRYGEGRLGNLKETPLSEIWQNSALLKELRNRENLTGRCGKCTYRYICGGCRINAYNLRQDILAEDPLCWRGRSEEELDYSPPPRE